MQTMGLGLARHYPLLSLSRMVFGFLLWAKQIPRTGLHIVDPYNGGSLLSALMYGSNLFNREMRDLSMSKDFVSSISFLRRVLTWSFSHDSQSSI